MTLPAYNLGEERRDAVRLLRRLVNAHAAGQLVELERVVALARRWICEHDDMVSPAAYIGAPGYLSASPDAGGET